MPVRFFWKRLPGQLPFACQEALFNLLREDGESFFAEYPEEILGLLIRSNKCPWQILIFQVCAALN